MSTTDWPKLLDICEDDARRLLRTLEISAYSSVVAAFRAQGDLSVSKKQALEQLQLLLGYVSTLN